METQDIVKRAGGPTVVGKAVGRSHSAVCCWSRVPAEHVRKVAELAGLHPHDVRPDLYDPPASAPEAA